MRRTIPTCVAALTIANLILGPAAVATADAHTNQSRQQQREVRAAGFGGAVEFGPCTLYPSVMHLRTSEPGHIGPKPYTKCDFPVDSIKQVTELYYEWYAWWKPALKVSGGNRGERVYTQRRVAFRCQGTEGTVWAGTTAGTVVYKGHTYYARVWQKQVRLPCGA